MEMMKKERAYQLIVNGGVSIIPSDFENLFLEDPILPTLSTISSGRGRRDMKDAFKTIKLAEVVGGPAIKPIDLSIEEISKDWMVWLFSKAHNGVGNMQDFVTGLRVHFGYENNKVILLFQPMVMEKLRYDPRSGDTIYKVPDGSIGYYRFNGTEFDTITTDQLESLKEDYQDLIRIKRKRDAPNYDNFNPDPQTGDPDSIIVSFYSIAFLLEENSGDKIIFYHSLDDREGSIRHSLLLATKPIINPGSDELLYSDRSHLCPPCTAEVGYDLYSL